MHVSAFTTTAPVAGSRAMAPVGQWVTHGASVQWLHASDRWKDGTPDRRSGLKGTTWRQIDEATRAAVVDSASARRLLLAQPSLIKRPVVRWSDGALTVGFDATDWAARR